MGLAVALAAGTMPQARALNVQDTTNPIHLTLAAQAAYQGPAWVSLTDVHGVTSFSSAFQINAYTLILSAHQLIDSNGAPRTINHFGNSLNFNAPGQLGLVDEFYIKPGFNPVDWRQTGDVAVAFLRYDAELRWGLPYTVPFGPVTANQTGTVYGVGNFGDPIVGNLGQTGDIHGGEGYVLSETLFGYNNSLFFEATNSANVGAERAYGAPGDSGGGWVFPIASPTPGGPTTYLGGISSYATLGAPVSLGLTGASRLDGSNLDFLVTTINDYETNRVVPETSTALLFALSLIPAALARRRNQR